LLKNAEEEEEEAQGNDGSLWFGLWLTLDRHPPITSQML